MDVKDIFHVAVYPFHSENSSLIKDIAEVVNKHVYDTRLLLIGTIPRIIAHYEDKQVAYSVANSLSKLGLTVLVCSDLELRRPADSFIVHTLVLKDGYVLFIDINGNEKKVKPENVTLLIKFNLLRSSTKEDTETSFKFSLTRTVIMGGFPMFRKVTEKKSETSTSMENSLRIYEKGICDSFVELRQHHIDYSFLENKLTPSSFTNFNTVTMKLREKFGKAAFNENLYKTPSSESSNRLRDDHEINCKLIYLFHNLMNDHAENSL